MKGTRRCRGSPFISVLLGCTELTQTSRTIWVSLVERSKEPSMYRTASTQSKAPQPSPEVLPSRRCLLPYTLMPPPHHTWELVHGLEAHMHTEHSTLHTCHVTASIKLLTWLQIVMCKDFSPSPALCHRWGTARQEQDITEKEGSPFSKLSVLLKMVACTHAQTLALSHKPSLCKTQSFFTFKFKI